MSPLRQFLALSLSSMGRRPDLMLAAGVAFIVAMIIVPLPPFLLDSLIAFNIGAALMLLMVALMAKKALEVSTFPTLLLITTLFRLGLNVSTTRGILSHGDGGNVVEAFGHFVVQGDLVVGLVIFAVITVVQFLVVTKGAERVAEVGARFTLDAMPGKQMSIDASLRSGALSEEEAEQKREDLSRLCQLFGNMDGAMKFVKGDAIAALIITGLNLVAGFAIGVLRLNLSVGAAIETYAVLSIGDALVSQLPAFLVTLAAGVLVTRVDARDAQADLGASVKSELGAHPKVFLLGAVFMGLLSLIPGLPALPFLAMAAMAVALGMSSKLIGALNLASPKTGTEVRAEKQRAQKKQIENKKKAKDQALPGSVLPLTLELGDHLSRELGLDPRDQRPESEVELLETYLPQLREALFAETGVEFPGVHVRPFVAAAPRDGFIVRIKDVPVLSQEIRTDRLMAMATPAKLRRLGVKAEPGRHPLMAGPVAYVTAEDERVVKSSGVQVWSPAGVVALHLGAVLRESARDFVGLQEVSKMLERLGKLYPDLVREVVPKFVTLAQLAEVMRRLVEEGVSVRDLKSILEAIAAQGPTAGDTVALTESVRAELGKQIAHVYAGLTNRLSVVLLDPLIEDVVSDGMHLTGQGCTLTLDPAILRKIVRAVAEVLKPAAASGATLPVVLTSAKVRRLVRKIIETDLPDIPVLSFEELPGKLNIHPLGRAVID